MRICLLTDEVIGDFNPSGYLKNYDLDYLTVSPPAVEFIAALSHEQSYDVYLNLYEGLDEGENSGSRFVRALEDLNLPFTGAESKFYNATREEMQAVARENQIGFARGFHAGSHAELCLAAGLVYPLIVKHPNSFASAGMTKDSRVINSDELRTQFERVSAAFGSVRVEEFIEGREFSCLVVENAEDPNLPFLYSPAEVQFPPDESFLHEDAKWYNWDVYVVPLQDEALSVRLQDVSRKFFLALNGNGYARVDIRVRPNGEIVIIEINPNCGILYGPEDRSHSDLPISWDPGGHGVFLERIFRAALHRQTLRMRNQKHPAE